MQHFEMTRFFLIECKMSLTTQFLCTKVISLFIFNILSLWLLSLILRCKHLLFIQIDLMCTYIQLHEEYVIRTYTNIQRSSYYLPSLSYLCILYFVKSYNHYAAVNFMHRYIMSKTSNKKSVNAAIPRSRTKNAQVISAPVLRYGCPPQRDTLS